MQNRPEDVLGASLQPDDLFYRRVSCAQDIFSELGQICAEQHTLDLLARTNDLIIVSFWHSAQRGVVQHDEQG